VAGGLDPPGGDALLVRAGVGWEDGVVGNARVGTNLESQAGYALISTGPVLCEDLHQEVRFKGAPLLHDHGIVSGVTAAILTGETHFGVLGAHSQELRRFSPADARFVGDVAGLLGAAIGRAVAEERSRETLGEHAGRAEAAEDRFRFLARANALLSASSADYPTTLRNAARLAEACRRAGVPVVHVWFVVEPGAPGVTMNAPLFEGLRAANALVRGTWGAAPVPGLEPQEGDFVVEKSRMSAFEGSRLETVLKALGRNVVIVTGAWTNMSIEHTARTGADKGYLMVIPEDACSTMNADWHRASIGYAMQNVALVTSTDAVIAALG